MRYLVYLMTLLFVGTAIAQNPTIVQGNYITNVFGNSNFVLNPNALTNVANVAVSNATVTRSTTTPLVATSEFLVTVTSANGTIAWNTRTFDGGMKGQNCEARFTYRGFQSTSVAQVRQGATVAGANVVARLALTASTDPRIASINFPCGDLSQPTYFVITDTATLSGTNEIGGIYVGLATNMANVAQAESVVEAYKSSAQVITSGAGQTIIYNVERFDQYGEFDTSTGIFTAKRAGNYQFNASILWTNDSWSAGNPIYLAAQKNNVDYKINLFQSETAQSYYKYQNLFGVVQLSVGDTLKFVAQQTSGTNKNLYVTEIVYPQLSISRFPSTSELVVTPERQNVWGSIDGTGLDSTTSSGSYVTPTGFSISGTKGKCLADGTNLACKISTLPPGTYKVDVTMPYFAVAGSTAQNCYVQITDNKGAVDAATAQAGNAGAGLNDGISHVSRTFTYTSVQTDIIFTLKHKQAAGTGGSCGIYTASGPRYWQMNVIPLDQPSNSALYVQGPVQAAATGAAIPAGSVGEVKRETRTRTAAIALTSGTAANITSNAITLTPGVWMISAGAGITGTATSISRLDLSISTTSATHSGGDDIPWLRNYNNFATYNLGNGDVTGYLPPYYVNITTNTTYYAVIGSIFSGGNAYAFGYIQAVRVN